MKNDEALKVQTAALAQEGMQQQEQETPPPESTTSATSETCTKDTRVLTPHSSHDEEGPDMKKQRVELVTYERVTEEIQAQKMAPSDQPHASSHPDATPAPVKRAAPAGADVIEEQIQELLSQRKYAEAAALDEMRNAPAQKVAKTSSAQEEAKMKAETQFELYPQIKQLLDKKDFAGAAVLQERAQQQLSLIHISEPTRRS